MTSDHLVLEAVLFISLCSQRVGRAEAHVLPLCDGRSGEKSKTGDWDVTPAVHGAWSARSALREHRCEDQERLVRVTQGQPPRLSTCNDTSRLWLSRAYEYNVVASSRGAMRHTVAATSAASRLNRESARIADSWLAELPAGLVASRASRNSTVVIAASPCRSTCAAPTTDAT